MYKICTKYLKKKIYRRNVLPAALVPSQHCCILYADGHVHRYTKYQVSFFLKLRQDCTPIWNSFTQSVGWNVYRSCATRRCSGCRGARPAARHRTITVAARDAIATCRVRAQCAWRLACMWAACYTAEATSWAPSPRPSTTATWSSSAAPSSSRAMSYSCCRPAPKTRSATDNLSGLSLKD